ncbi:hypothetical protein [Dyadobacter alkalitolerans]|nr:hypothetical protein [Dyadobacter alkalitolerans]
MLVSLSGPGHRAKARYQGVARPVSLSGVEGALPLGNAPSTPLRLTSIEL